MRTSSKTVLNDIHQIADSADYVRDIKFHERLSMLLINLMEDAWDPEGQSQGRSAAPLDIQEIKDYLDQHFREKITLDQLAAQFFINKFYLSTLFKARYGITMGKNLMQRKITFIKQQLRFSNLSLEEIAADLGMDSGYLTRMFKNSEGVAPSVYRKQWNGK